MGEGDTAFNGSIPRLYEQLLVPLIFAPYARDMAERVVAVQPRAVLETSAGTGALTRELQARLPASATIIATDLNQAMLAEAKVRLSAPNIEWRQVDAQQLPFGGDRFDVVVCQFGVMFFADRARGFMEARRVLRHGGHYFFNTWGPIEDNVFTDVVSRALAGVFPGDPPRFMARTPHGYFDADVIGADLARAGFEDITIETVDEVSRAACARDVARAFCQGTPLRGEIEARGAPGLEAATDATEAALTRRFGEGALEGGIRALVVSAANVRK